MNRLQLLDLPPAWLISLVLAMPRAWHLTDLFSTCNKLKLLIFRQTAVRPVLFVHPDRIQEKCRPVHGRCIAMAEAAGIKLHLKLQGAWVPGGISLLLTSAALIHHLQQPQPQQLPVSYQLNCITAITMCISEPPQKSFLPDVLVQHCPNLTELELEQMTLTGVADEDGTPPQLTCTSLQKLCLYRVAGLSSEEFSEQLLNLPNLTALVLFNSGNTDIYEEDGMVWEAIAKYSSQLKVLCCIPAEGDFLPPPWSPTTQLPVLQELHLSYNFYVDDAAMRQVLHTTPNLKIVKFHSVMGLTSSFAQVPCSWQEVTLTHVHVAQLAKLPLSSCTALVCVDTLRLSDPKQQQKPTPEHITAGVAAAQAVGGLHCIQADIRLHTDDMLRLIAAAPLLQQIKYSATARVYKSGTDQLAPWSGCRPLLAVLGQHLKCKKFSFWQYNWAPDPRAIPELPELLPHMPQFDVPITTPAAELVQMLRTAARPFTLRGYSSRFKAQLQQAMQEAGHQLVTLEDAA